MSVSDFSAKFRRFGALSRYGAILLFLSVSAGSSTVSGVLRHQAYIWQRHWTPALTAAVRDSSGLVTGWRVLAAETDGSGRLRPTAIDWRALDDSGLPVVPVFRLDGQLEQRDQEKLLADLDTILGQWHRKSAALTGVEIDHDCATSKLPAYADFLAKVKSRIGPKMLLSITALPTWLNSPRLDGVLEATDQVVLQVHAVQNPREGLFDARLALRWIAAMAARDRKPFQVALPDYGLRVDWRDDGTILAVEGEMPDLAESRDDSELVASPSEVTELIHRLDLDHPANLVGIVWFRLPTENDDRAWSPATWRAVVSGQALIGDIAVTTTDGTIPGLRNVVLVNSGNSDSRLPQSLALPAKCTAADGINGYTLEYGPSGRVLKRLRDGLLQAGHRREIGWIRCPGDGEVIHVDW